METVQDAMDLTQLVAIVGHAQVAAGVAVGWPWYWFFAQKVGPGHTNGALGGARTTLVGRRGIPKTGGTRSLGLGVDEHGFGGFVDTSFVGPSYHARMLGLVDNQLCHGRIVDKMIPDKGWPVDLLSLGLGLRGRAWKWKWFAISFQVRHVRLFGQTRMLWVAALPLSGTILRLVIIVGFRIPVIQHGLCFVKTQNVRILVNGSVLQVSPRRQPFADGGPIPTWNEVLGGIHKASHSVWEPDRNRQLASAAY